jgi:hypothetical protein
MGKLEHYKKKKTEKKKNTAMVTWISMPVILFIYNPIEKEVFIEENKSF